mmetsp:Transcript_50358/g.100150  ORF Transcript_50358/g.100150 Transcript_50358/m.100150 type:complete len:209 (+) Transcript_50358:1481-2107(+)
MGTNRKGGSAIDSKPTQAHTMGAPKRCLAEGFNLFRSSTMTLLFFCRVCASLQGVELGAGKGRGLTARRAAAALLKPTSTPRAMSCCTTCDLGVLSCSVPVTLATTRSPAEMAETMAFCISPPAGFVCEHLPSTKSKRTIPPTPDCFALSARFVSSSALPAGSIMGCGRPLVYSSSPISMTSKSLMPAFLKTTLASEPKVPPPKRPRT